MTTNFIKRLKAAVKLIWIKSFRGRCTLKQSAAAASMVWKWELNFRNFSSETGKPYYLLFEGTFCRVGTALKRHEFESGLGMKPYL